MIKTNTIALCSWLFRVTDKKSPPPGGRPEHRATDLRGRTRRKRPSQSLGRLHLSSCYFSQAFEDRYFRKILRIVEPLITRIPRMKRRFLPIRVIRGCFSQGQKLPGRWWRAEDRAIGSSKGHSHPAEKYIRPVFMFGHASDNRIPDVLSSLE
jgi:hypothetical protein